ncbi:hypothetical protein [Glaesserella parasuis]|uniref:hypothetical protein n=2 Tax=Glaesserella parasuis TaxID=738 RepID=UPI001040027E|nr:hypothetical protein [Glaesserella parasuis]MCT8582788.1 hypothetical protein [Glaesserella parasuis]MCT8585564.1 hypothetical protein [Glaesserella parasuis]MCT8664032.1 hypothetical protein [Glaesserella parasuis]MCT8721940.1 hypothetical protein [Glaesserella parasuis]MCT8728270.1 hypothetical protein [Glaesserella parasuis]
MATVIFTLATVSKFLIVSHNIKEYNSISHNINRDLIMSNSEFTFANAVQVAAILLRNDIEIYDKDGTHISENVEAQSDLACRLFMLASGLVEQHQARFGKPE